MTNPFLELRTILRTEGLNADPRLIQALENWITKYVKKVYIRHYMPAYMHQYAQREEYLDAMSKEDLFNKLSHALPQLAEYSEYNDSILFNKQATIYVLTDRELPDVD